MALTYDRSGKFIDSDSGVMVGFYGWADDEGTSFGFCDPHSDATSYKGQPWFRFSAYSIYDGDPPRVRRTIGYRIPSLKYLLAGYHKGDMEKLRYAERHIVAALSAYLTQSDGIANPRIELV